MYQTLFTRLALNSTFSSEVSQPVSMQGANAAQVDGVLFSLAGTTPSVSLQLQESNDLENWRNKGGSTDINTVSYSLGSSVGSINAAYIRLKVTLTGSSSPTAVISAGVSIAAL
jgi:hypothetical protein